MKRYVKCKVIGSGGDDDPYRPAFEVKFTELITRSVEGKNGLSEFKQFKVRVKNLKHKGYNCMYYPKDPPYSYCYVVLNEVEGTVFPVDTVLEEFNSLEQLKQCFEVDKKLSVKGL